MIPLFLSFSFVILAVLIRSLRRNAYPPGPRKFPIIGNLLQLPTSHQWVKFLEWAEQYGPIYHLKAGPDDLIVLNTPDLVDEFLVKHGRIFSDRMWPHVAADIVSAGQRLLFLPASSIEFKAVRKANHTALASIPARKYRRYQELESRVLLHDFINHGYETAKLMESKPMSASNADDHSFMERHWFSLVRRFATSVIMTAVYGERVHAIQGNDALNILYDVVETITKISLPGVFLADTFPFMQKFPDILAPWRKQAIKMHEREFGLYGGYLDKLHADHKAGINRPDCFIGKYIQARDASTDRIVSGAGVSEDGWIRDKLLTYTAGTLDRSRFRYYCERSQLIRAIHVMAREELDKVVGSDRLPSYEDEENLALCRCMHQGALTLSTTHAFGLFHSEGSLVFGNVWALHMDPARFPRPREFIPERWLNNEKGSGPLKWGSIGPKNERDK
ncbi:hypothetical protein VNI00_011152 [Paramarasmius palmivorus]|uniref:Cytochrome P450 n=1 Tax=Paramarasmius palmivorus TaxID=297713 RepID=A0AAW0CES4_9AGAR